MFALLEDRPNPKERKTDRILVLKTIEGKNTLASTGLTDNRLFTGENKLHAILDTKINLWYLKYDAGRPPGPLQQRFTSFSKLMEFTKRYFARRNIEIAEVLD